MGKWYTALLAINCPYAYDRFKGCFQSLILYSFHLPGRVCLILSINTQLFLTGAILFDVQTPHLEMTLSKDESNAKTVEPPEKSQKKVAVVERWPF